LTVLFYNREITTKEVYIIFYNFIIHHVYLTYGTALWGHMRISS
jgi:hypothetical protein